MDCMEVWYYVLVCLYCSIYINDSSALYWIFNYIWHAPLVCSLKRYRTRRPQSSVSSEIIETPTEDSFKIVISCRTMILFNSLLRSHVMSWNINGYSLHLLPQDESSSPVRISLCWLPMVVSKNFTLEVISSQMWPISFLLSGMFSISSCVWSFTAFDSLYRMFALVALFILKSWYLSKPKVHVKVFQISLYVFSVLHEYPFLAIILTMYSNADQ